MVGIDGGRDRWIDMVEWIDRGRYEWIYGWMDGWMMKGFMDEWIYELMDLGWMGG